MRFCIPAVPIGVLVGSFAALGVACSSERNGGTADASVDSGTDADTDSDTDSGTDADTDSGTDADTDSDTDTDTDSDTDTDTDSDTDADTGSEDEPASEMTSCDGGKLDPVTGLCWQDPGSAPMAWADAMSYCDALTSGGHDDWRLPLIQELITLLRGCVDGVATGDLSRSTCAVTDPGCLDWGCISACDDCPANEGPAIGEDGNRYYWDPGLTVEWDVSFEFFWSSSLYDGGSSDAFYLAVYFTQGMVMNSGEDGPGFVRCVR